MPRAASVAEICEKTLAELEREADSSLEKFMSAAENGSRFEQTMEKIEGQLAAARKLEQQAKDLELNEAQVIAEKLEGELAHAEKLALGRALLDMEEGWAADFEGVKNSLEMMHAYMRKMKLTGRASAHEGSTLEARNALLSFRREAGKCRSVLEKLDGTFSSRKHSAYAKLEAAKRGLKKVRAGVGSAFSKMTKARLRKQIKEARLQIENFFSGTHRAKMFVDHKHLTLQSGAHKVHLPLTQAVRYALEEMVPIEAALSKLGKRGTMVTATYERGRDGAVLHVGERSVAGDAIIYRERSYNVNFGS